ncbi:MAG: electron transfer flavoprotein subunit beta [Chloroflexi bacterium]|nr:MAG: electron transfer flavoprotein subunit beta [Chloroflexota bacterium]
MRIVVLTKPVPDPAAGQERLTAEGRVDRAGSPAVVNGNDEYALEAALKLVEASPDGGEVTLLAMAPSNAPETLRKALAMGAHRGVLVTDPALEGSDTLSTARVLAAALREMEYDLVLAGADTSDGGGGVVAAGIAAILGLPYLSYAARIEPAEGRVRVRRLSATGFDVIEAPMPALVVATQGARSKEITTRALSDLDVDGATPGGAAATAKVTGSRKPEQRGATKVVRVPAPEAAKAVVDFLAQRRII